MATIYVRTTGNDTTGNGSTGTPYLTLAKALSVAANSDLILMGTGTYSENNGSGYLTLNGLSFGSTYVTVTTETGEQDVIITSAGTHVLALAAVTGIWFDNLIWQSSLTTTATVHRYLSGSKSTLYFTRNKIRVKSPTGTVNTAIASAWTGAGAYTISGVIYNKCDIEQIGHWPSYGVNLDNQSTGTTITEIDFIDCNATTAHSAFRIRGVTNTRQIGCKFNSFSPAIGANTYQIGEDAATGAAASAIASNCTSYSQAGHAAVIGGGVTEWVGDNMTFTGGSNSSAGQGCVFKDSTNFRMMRSTVHGGYNSGLYFKAAYNGLVVDCAVYNKYASSSAIRTGLNSEDNSKAHDVSARRCFFYARAGKGIDWSSAGDTGGSVFDQNVYHVTGTATLGDIGATSVTTIAGLQAAWSSYDRPANDGRSRLGMKSVIHAGDLISG